MRILLDTHVLLWALTDSDRLSDDVRAIVRSPENDVLFSAASIWELAIKVQIGRLGLGMQPEEVRTAALDAGFAELAIRGDVAARVSLLPMHHRDPFDRLLVAQALAEPARLYTADAILARYSDLITLL